MLLVVLGSSFVSDEQRRTRRCDSTNPTHIGEVIVLTDFSQVSVRSKEKRESPRKGAFCFIFRL